MSTHMHSNNNTYQHTIKRGRCFNQPKQSPPTHPAFTPLTLSFHKSVTMSSFPIGSSVLLQNLKSEQYNDKHGIVRSRLDPMSGRQEVYIFDLEKSMSIKPINIKYEPREIESLSISEMKGLLLSSSKTESELNELSKDDLQKMVADVATDPEEIAALVAKSNEPKTPPAATNNNSSTNGSFTSEQLKQATDRMSNMNPDQLRQQAATMKAMGPAALRNMNPQMAHMTDDQINMAISQMVSVHMMLMQL